MMQLSKTARSRFGPTRRTPQSNVDLFLIFPSPTNTTPRARWPFVWDPGEKVSIDPPPWPSDIIKFLFVGLVLGTWESNVSVSRRDVTIGNAFGYLQFRLFPKYGDLDADFFSASGTHGINCLTNWVHPEVRSQVIMIMINYISCENKYLNIYIIWGPTSWVRSLALSSSPKFIYALSVLRKNHAPRKERIFVGRVGSAERGFSWRNMNQRDWKWCK